MSSGEPFFHPHQQLVADALLTGHYARSEQRPDGSWALLRAPDPAKDQSYFLHGLTQEALRLRSAT